GTITGKELAQQQATGPNRQAAATAAAASAAGATAPSGGTAGSPLPPRRPPPRSAPKHNPQTFWGLYHPGYTCAEAALRAFVAQHPNDPLAGNAQYWLGETYYVRKDYRQAAVAFAEGYQKYPTNSKAPDNLLKLGLALAQIGEKADACEALSQLGK